jgi:hypothetical protein
MHFAPRLLAAAALGLPIASHASPSDYVYYPGVEYGEREIDFKYGTAKAKDLQGGGRESAGSIGFGYGAAERWFTEAYLKYHKVSGDKAGYDAVEWENKFALTEPNQYFADVGLITEIEIPKERRTEGYEFRIGPLFQFDTGALRWNANLLFARVFRGVDPHVTEMGYQLQARYTLSRELEVGVQAFGEMGRWNRWESRDEQNHRIGPAVFGKLKLEGRQAIRYNAAFLCGETKAAPRNTFRLQAEYEF